MPHENEPRDADRAGTPAQDTEQSGTAPDEDKFVYDDASGLRILPGDDDPGAELFDLS